MTAERDALDFGNEFEGAQETISEGGPVVPGRKEAPGEAEKPAEPAQKQFRREIDLGDGSGVQVFEADTQGELIDKLTDAQRNATKKIQDLDRQAKSRARPRRVREPKRPTQPTDVVAPRPLSVEEEADLQNKLLANPGAALKRWFEGTLGVTADGLRRQHATLDKVERLLNEQDAATEFVDRNDSYYASNKNHRAIMRFLRDEDLEVSADNLQYAFDELSADGLLETEPVAAAAATADKTKEAPKAKQTGISAAQTTTPESATPAKLPTADELNKLPLDQARDRIVSTLRESQRLVQS